LISLIKSYHNQKLKKKIIKENEIKLS
jgi:hypothetical protein